MSRPESRVFFHIAYCGPLLASEISDQLQLDRGYVSRVLLRLEGNQLVSRDTLDADGRKRVIKLSRMGLNLFNEISKKQQRIRLANNKEWGALEQDDLTDALTKTRLLLSIMSGQPTSWQFEIRPFRTRDISLVAARQVRNYSVNHLSSSNLELFEEQMSRAFIHSYDPSCEQSFIAEIGVTMVGAVVIINNDGELACIHLLYVEHFARGRGIGDALLQKAIEFARERHYREISLTLPVDLKEIQDVCARVGFRKESIYAQPGSDVLYADLSLPS